MSITTQILPVSYIVLDHQSVKPRLGTDGYQRHYVHTSPAVLDAIRIPEGDAPDLAPRILRALNLIPPLDWEQHRGVPVYRRMDMADHWPGRLG